MAAGAQAQTAGSRLKISNLRIEERGDNLTVYFQAEVPRRAVKGSYTLVNSPVITNAGYSVSLAPIIVQGRGAEVVRKRQEMATGADFNYDGATYARNGEIVSYSATVPSQAWMQGAELQMESVLFGCCSRIGEESSLLADNIAIRGDRIEYTKILPEMPEDVFVPQTLADTLAISFPFVADISQFDANEPFRIYDDERDNALIVYYLQGSNAITPNYKDNRQTLTNITSVVSMIMNDRGSEVERIVIAGFASPEGSSEVNNRLARQRAEAVMEHIKANCSVPESRFVIFNGSVDWQGLSLMVRKSNMPEKYQVLDIIENTPIWDSRRQIGRLGELQRMNGGRTYRYMFNEFFPDLRNGAFIKVYYQNKE